jgi:hypothetical protein
VSPVDLERFEAQLDEALRTRNTEALDVIGYGEVSVAVKLSTEGGDYACKRLVPFDAERDVERAALLIHQYVERLEACGLDVVPTQTVVLARPVGFVLYCVQPLLAAGTMGPSFLRAMSPDEARPHVERVFTLIRASVSPTLAPDGQLSNWSFDGDRVRYLDVGTPFMRDDAGRDLFDFRQQTRALPQPIRTIVNRFLVRSILDNYHSPRGQALDFLGNLIKEGLGHLMPSLIPSANEVFGLSPPIGESEVLSHYKSDAQSYALMQAARRTDRWFQESILRRTYPYLLPPKIDRGVA